MGYLRGKNFFKFVSERSPILGGHLVRIELPRASISNGIAEAFIAREPLLAHAFQNGYGFVHIVIDDDVTLGRIRSMQAPAEDTLAAFESFVASKSEAVGRGNAAGPVAGTRHDRASGASSSSTGILFRVEQFDLHGTNIVQAAKLLRISRATFYKKLAKLGLAPRAPRLFES